MDPPIWSSVYLVCFANMVIMVKLTACLRSSCINIVCHCCDLGPAERGENLDL